LRSTAEICRKEIMHLLYASYVQVFFNSKYTVLHGLNSIETLVCYFIAICSFHKMEYRCVLRDMISV
jgi:hypothetical protein